METVITECNYLLCCTHWHCGYDM